MLIFLDIINPTNLTDLINLTSKFRETSNVAFEFSQNFNVEYLENLESVKTIPETNFKIFLKIKIQGFCDKEILCVFYKVLYSLSAS